MYSELKEIVCKANIELHAHGLAPFTWGNVSEVDRNLGVFAIKPSGVPYSDLTPDKIVVVHLQMVRWLMGIITPHLTHLPTTFFTKSLVTLMQLYIPILLMHPRLLRRAGVFLRMAQLTQIFRILQYLAHAPLQILRSIVSMSIIQAS